jgi:hypothetical protein
MKNVCIILTVFAGMLLSKTSTFAQNWKSLVNDKELSGWEKRNGTAEFLVEGDQVIGISKVGTPSTYLCTKEKYTDFILEVEVKVEVGLNSWLSVRNRCFGEKVEWRHF